MSLLSRCWPRLSHLKADLGWLTHFRDGPLSWMASWSWVLAEDLSSLPHGGSWGCSSVPTCWQLAFPRARDPTESTDTWKHHCLSWPSPRSHTVSSAIPLWSHRSALFTDRRNNKGMNPRRRGWQEPSWRLATTDPYLTPNHQITQSVCGVRWSRGQKNRFFRLREI